VEEDTNGEGGCPSWTCSRLLRRRSESQAAARRLTVTTAHDSTYHINHFAYEKAKRSTKRLVREGTGDERREGLDVLLRERRNDRGEHEAWQGDIQGVLRHALGRGGAEVAGLGDEESEASAEARMSR
jgi:hypothetical protein